jgi:hypothetical protein
MSRECQSLATCPSLGGRHLVKIRRRWNLPILFGAFVPLDPRPYVEGDTGHLLAAQAALARVHPRADAETELAAEFGELSLGDLLSR